MASSRPLPRPQSSTSERIPFYRNVKVIGSIAQIIFVIIVFGAATIIYLNVTRALRQSNLPADFNFLGVRAGIPIAETPIRYTTNDPYWRALLIGFLNTLNISLVGVVLATLLGILVGVMRLSANWLLRQLSTAFVELVRNTPLAVQIVFWFTAILTPLPPRVSNPIQLPGGMLLSNIGLAMPWPQATHNFVLWLPWLAGALFTALLAYSLRRRHLERAERPGNPWLMAVIMFALISIVGYFIVPPSIPEGAVTEFRPDRGRGQVFIDQNQNQLFDGDETLLPFMATRVHIESAQLRTTSQNTTESRRVVSSIFRFPLIQEHEVADAEVVFADPEAAAAENLALHFQNFPSQGVVYQDRNNNGRFDSGEEINPETGRGFSGYALTLRIYDFRRDLVADRDGQVRLPRFDPIAEEAAPATAAPARPGGNLFGPPVAAPAAEEATLEANFEVLPMRPLVLSRPSIPVSNYEGGVTLSTSFLALLLALVIHTAGFIAEIVRGGIQAVAKGQTEAATSLGLSPWQIFSLIVFPQALRIILPPMISQYLNLSKNSSLAPLAAYVELFAISVIIANQTGATIPVILIIIAAYLLISFLFAFVLNIVNDRIALVER